LSGLITWVVAPAGAGVSRPSTSVLATMLGVTRTPLLAMAWYIPASCSRVIDTPCPMGRLPNVLADQVDCAGSTPEDSAGSWMPVLVPWPSFLASSSNASGPTCWAIIRVPTLDDLPRMPVAVMSTGPCAQASCTVMPPTSIDPSTFSTVSGLIRPFSNAAAKVTTLFTDPGSMESVTARLPVSLVVSPGW